MKEGILERISKQWTEVFKEWTHQPKRGQEGTTLTYTKEQRLDIGRRIYEDEISKFEAAEEYGIGIDTARSYMRLYRAEHHLPVKHTGSDTSKIKESLKPPMVLEDYETMTKEELIHELIQAKIAEARLKKGYEVKGVGDQKEYGPIDSKNTK